MTFLCQVLQQSGGFYLKKVRSCIFIQTCEDVPEKNTYNVLFTLFTFCTHLKFEIFFIIYEFKAFSYIAEKLLYTDTLTSLMAL